MRDFDPDSFAERAAILEHCAGLSRFRAETLAAQDQGITRWEALRHEADSIGHSARVRHHGEVADRQPAMPLPAMQSRTKEENGPLPERDLHAGRGGVDVLALRMEGRPQL